MSTLTFCHMTPTNLDASLGFIWQTDTISHNCELERIVFIYEIKMFCHKLNPLCANLANMIAAAAAAACYRNKHCIY